MILKIYLLGVILSYIYTIYTAYKYKKEVLVSDLVICLLMSAIGSYLALIVFLCMEFINSKYWNKRIF